MFPYPELDLRGVDNLIVIIGLIILALEDIRYGEIHYRYLLLIVGFSYLSGYILMLICIILYDRMSKYIGGADLLIFCLLITKYGYNAISYIVLVASSLALLYSLVLKKKQIRFIPFILIGTLTYLGGII